MEAYSVRQYTEGDENGIVPLLREVFNGWPHLDTAGDSLEYWHWKFASDMYGEKLIVVAFAGPRIVGAIHSVPVKIKLFDKTHLGNLGGDVAVQTDYRKLGVWKAILQKANEIRRVKNVEWLYNVTANPIIIDTFKQMKEFKEFPVPVANLTRIRDIDKQLQMMPTKNQSVKKIGFNVLKIHNRLVNEPKLKTVKHGKIQVRDIDQFDERINKFWESIAPQYDYIIERKRDFLNWRYLDPRVGGFTVKQAEEKGEVLGFIVTRTNKFSKDYPIGYIVDLLTLPERKDAAHALVTEAVKQLDEENINIVNYQIAKGHPYEEILNTHGFIDSRMKIGIFYNPLLGEERIGDLTKLAPERTYVSWGDYDTLPVKTEKT